MSIIFSDGFPKEIKRTLSADLETSASISSPTVASILGKMDIDIGTLMVMLLPTASSYAVVPISGFHVGAIALGLAKPDGPGTLYLGSNMEFTGQALLYSVHGEQSATNNAWISGETGLQAIAINAAPCGYCRQFLYETSTANKGFEVLLKENADPKDFRYKAAPLTHFLPDAFGPANLKISDRLMQASTHGFRIDDPDPVIEAALKAANASYAPYTQNASGVALQLDDGQIFAGRYAENAAFNPSMSPLESALAWMNMNRPAGARYYIEDAVLVENASSVISQKEATKAVLSSVAPSVRLRHFPV
ncbi:MAG: cytidine deaminase [Pseudomonadota bacterium]